MEKIRDIVIVGVGGWIILASQILGQAAIVGGFDVKVAETHGMAQRGGSVVTHVRLGQEVFSTVELGSASACWALNLRRRSLPSLNQGLISNTENASLMWPQATRYIHDLEEPRGAQCIADSALDLAQELVIPGGKPHHAGGVVGLHGN